jgi:Zn-dependent protease
VFLLEPAPTPFDLRWRMFGIDVRVHPFFWLVAALLGWPFLRAGFGLVLVWIGCVFVSVLIHELGHVFAGRVFGADGHIVLYSFGGLAIGSSDLRRRWQRVLVYFAGPLAGFLLFGVVVAALFLLRAVELPPLVRAAISFLIWINLGWGILNLLPIWPLDGGRISRDLLEWLTPERGAAVALGISGTLAGLLAVNALMATYGRPLIPWIPFDGLYVAIMFGLLAISSFQMMQMENAARARREDDRLPWERDEEEEEWRR